MGSLDKYFVLMQINREQEYAIRYLFNERNWLFWNKVLSEDAICQLQKDGYNHLFSVLKKPSVESDTEVLKQMEADSPTLCNINAGTPAVEKPTREISISPCYDKFKTVKVEVETLASEDESTMDYEISDEDDGSDEKSQNNYDCELSKLIQHIKQEPNEVTDTCIVDTLQDGVSDALLSNTKQLPRLKCKPIAVDASESAAEGSTSLIKTDIIHLAGYHKRHKRRCHFCGIVYSSKGSLKRHWLRCHQEQLPNHSCSICFHDFQTKKELWDHVKETGHRKPKILPKNVKPAVDGNENSGDGDEFFKSKTQKQELECQYCGGPFSHARSLRRHWLRMHRDDIPKYSCTACSASFTTRDELWRHNRENKHGKTQWDHYQCETCGKVLRQYKSFKDHQRCCVDSTADRYPCDICGMMFPNTMGVNHHKREVHVVDPQTCQICGRVCLNKRKLMSHQFRHNDDNRKYSCDDCGKSFWNAHLLKQHIRTHTKEKPYRCPLCRYSCAIKGNLRKHAHKVHKDKMEDPTFKDDLLKPLVTIKYLQDKQPTVSVREIEQSYISYPPQMFMDIGINNTFRTAANQPASQNFSHARLSSENLGDKMAPQNFSHASLQSESFGDRV